MFGNILKKMETFMNVIYATKNMEEKTQEQYYIII